MELALVYQGTPMLVIPLKGRLALVYHGTPMLASHSFIFAINTPCPFWKNHVDFYVEIDEEIDEKVR